MTQDLLPPETTTLAQGRAWLEPQLFKGAKCPCCTQHVQAYIRPLGKPQARWLIWLVQTYERELARYSRAHGDPSIWIDIQHAPLRGGDYAKLSHWGLVERKGGKEPKAHRGSGLWRPTAKGIDLAYDRINVPSHVVLLRGSKLRFLQTRITIRQALGKDIDYDQLINTPPQQRLTTPTEMVKA
jgi:hypothetical protein